MMFKLFMAVSVPLMLTSAVDYGEVRLDRRDPADAALIRFAQSHPKCELWTDWRTMCSRTGVNGAPRCQIDPDMRVKPSEPFCAAQADAVGRWPKFETSAQWKSAGRFCRSADDRVRPFKQGSSDRCQYASKRPFNGLRVNSRSHPWCAEWKDKATLQSAWPNSGYRAAPAKDGQPGFYCARRVVPQWCAGARGFGQTPSQSPEAAEVYKGQDIVVGGLDYDMLRSVSGMYCGARLTDQAFPQSGR